MEWQRSASFATWAADHAIEPRYVYGLSFDTDANAVKVYEWDRDGEGKLVVEQDGELTRIKHREPYRITVQYLPLGLPLWRFRRKPNPLALV